MITKRKKKFDPSSFFSFIDFIKKNLIKMKIKVSSVLAGLVFCNSISAVVIREDEMSQLHSLKNLTRHDTSNQQKKSSNRLLKPVSFSAPPASVFPTIEHPYPPVYADYNYNKVVPTNSWISNLFYPSVNHLAPTTPDPYILRLLDDFGGNPGLTISQPHDKVRRNFIVYFCSIVY
jgi:hypothetical protein